MPSRHSALAQDVVSADLSVPWCNRWQFGRLCRRDANRVETREVAKYPYLGLLKKGEAQQKSLRLVVRAETGCLRQPVGVEGLEPPTLSL